MSPSLRRIRPSAVGRVAPRPPDSVPQTFEHPKVWYNSAPSGRNAGACIVLRRKTPPEIQSREARLLFAEERLTRHRWRSGSSGERAKARSNVIPAGTSISPQTAPPTNRLSADKRQHGVLILHIVTSKRNAGQETRGGRMKEE